MESRNKHTASPTTPVSDSRNSRLNVTANFVNFSESRKSGKSIF